MEVNMIHVTYNSKSSMIKCDFNLMKTIKLK